MQINERQTYTSIDVINAVSELLRKEAPADWVVDEWENAPIMWFTEIPEMEPYDSSSGLTKQYDAAARAFFNTVRRAKVVMHVGDGKNPHPYRSSLIVERELSKRLKALLTSKSHVDV